MVSYDPVYHIFSLTPDLMTVYSPSNSIPIITLVKSRLLLCRQSVPDSPFLNSKIPQWTQCVIHLAFHFMYANHAQARLTILLICKFATSLGLILSLFYTPSPSSPSPPETTQTSDPPTCSFPLRALFIFRSYSMKYKLLKALLRTAWTLTLHSIIMLKFDWKQISVWYCLTQTACEWR